MARQTKLTRDKARGAVGLAMRYLFEIRGKLMLLPCENDRGKGDTCLCQRCVEIEQIELAVNWIQHQIATHLRRRFKPNNERNRTQ